MNTTPAPTPRPKPTRDLTSNPALWDCYWGSHRVLPDDATITPEIFRNRDALASRYGLKLTKVFMPSCYPELNTHDHELDHPETYRTKSNGIMLLVSNYGTTPNPALGLKETEPLYSLSCKSYMRVFESPKHMRAVFKQAMQSKQARRVLQ